MNNEQNILIFDDFKRIALLDPIKQGAGHLKIISGYATPTMASWHIKEIAESEETLNPIEITLIVGMCLFDGISRATHEGFKDVVYRNNDSQKAIFTCLYVIAGAPVHSKLYLWEREGSPFRAFMGSANY